MTLLILLMRWWRAHQRAIDLQVLWPICKREAAARSDPEHALDLAKAGFAVHAFHDEAWLSLGEDAIIRAIDELQ
jgi:hypothetical protein